MTHPKALGVLLFAIASCGGFLGLAFWLGIKEPWAGLLFLAIWGLVEHAKIDRLLAVTVGALVGVALAALLVYLPPAIGAGPGLVVSLLVILVAVYALILGWLPTAINATTMLYLSVVTIPHVLHTAAIIDVFVGLIAGVIFFGGLLLLSAKLWPPQPDAA